MDYMRKPNDVLSETITLLHTDFRTNIKKLLEEGGAKLARVRRGRSMWYRMSARQCGPSQRN
eukprot:1663699-Amphidinium_carterae.1